jgi:hypothetical protein
LEFYVPTTIIIQYTVLSNKEKRKLGLERVIERDLNRAHHFDGKINGRERGTELTKKLREKLGRRTLGICIGNWACCCFGG